MQNVQPSSKSFLKKIIENLKRTAQKLILNVYSRNSRSSNLRTIFVMLGSQSNTIMKLKRSGSQRD